MTQLLEKAYLLVTQLPESEQDSIALLILAELEDEEKWNRTFAASGGVLSRLGQKASAEYRADKTLPLNPDTLWTRERPPISVYNEMEYKVYCFTSILRSMVNDFEAASIHKSRSRTARRRKLRTRHSRSVGTAAHMNMNFGHPCLSKWTTDENYTLF